MKNFKVNASYKVYVSVDIKAIDEYHAKRVAFDLDESEFQDKGNFGDWKIDSIEEIKPTYWYCFEVYKHGYGVEGANFEEENGHSLSDAREKLLKAYPKAYILNEYKKITDGDE